MGFPLRTSELLRRTPVHCTRSRLPRTVTSAGKAAVDCHQSDEHGGILAETLVKLNIAVLFEQHVRIVRKRLLNRKRPIHFRTSDPPTAEIAIIFFMAVLLMLLVIWLVAAIHDGVRGWPLIWRCIPLVLLGHFGRTFLNSCSNDYWEWKPKTSLLQYDRPLPLPLQAVAVQVWEVLPDASIEVEELAHFDTGYFAILSIECGHECFYIDGWML